MGRAAPHPVILAGLVAVAAANALLWVFTVPFNEAPDEAAHFQVVRFILDRGRLPVFHPDDIWLLNTSKGVVESYAPFPPLAYLVGALASRLTEGTMWGARFVSVASYVATVALTYLVSARLGLSPLVGACAALAVAFLPQFAFTASYVNSDAIGVAVSALLIYQLTFLRSPPPSTWLLFGVGVTAGALILTKYTFFPVAAIGFIVAALCARRALPVAALCVGVAATSGWWFARNWLVYRELVPVRIIAEAKAAAGGNTLFVPAEYGITLLDLSTRTDFWWATYTSFVGKFGFISIELHPGYYLACLALVALAIGGAITHLLRLGAGPQEVRGMETASRSPRPIAAMVVGVAIMAGTALFAMASSAYGEYSPQGRYLFGALVPIAIGLAVGWSALGRAAPVLRFVPAAAALAIVALNFIALLGYVVPAHFSEGAERIVVQVDSRPGPSDATSRLAGWAFAEGRSSWTPLSPGAVAKYREPVSEVRVYEGASPPSGRLFAVAQYGLRRQDVAAFYGGYPAIDAVGYQFDLAPRTPASPGLRIYVCASGQRGGETCVSADRLP
jgi:4-amino-4-deoxy-L-arabinose transferase-like glycosyltransferase